MAGRPRIKRDNAYYDERIKVLKAKRNTYRQYLSKIDKELTAVENAKLKVEVNELKELLNGVE